MIPVTVQTSIPTPLIINNFVCDLHNKSIHPLVFFTSQGDLLSNFHGLWNWMSQQKGIL